MRTRQPRHSARFSAILTSVIGLALLAGCSSEYAPVPATAELPTSFFLSKKPQGELLLGACKASAKAGDEIVFQARIGGRAEPFVPERAIMVVIDPKLRSCKEIPGDTCAVPWDYCCEPSESLLANTATVQFVGDDGKPLHTGLKGHPKLKPLTYITVVGKVASADGAQFLINASGIFIDKEA